MNAGQVWVCSTGLGFRAQGGWVPYLVPSVAEADAGGVGATSALVGADEAGVGRGHLQHRVSPHMVIFRAACTKKKKKKKNGEAGFYMLRSMCKTVTLTWQCKLGRGCDSADQVEATVQCVC